MAGVLSEVSYTLPALVASAMFVFDSMFAYLFLPDVPTIMLDEEKERESGDEGLEGEIDVEKAKESQSEDEVVLPAQAKARQRWDIRAYLNWVLCVFKDTSVLFLIATSFAATLVRTPFTEACAAAADVHRDQAFTTYRVTFPMISQVRFDLDARANGFLLSYMGLLSVFVQVSTASSPHQAPPPLSFLTVASATRRDRQSDTSPSDSARGDLYSSRRLVSASPCVPARWPSVCPCWLSP